VGTVAPMSAAYEPEWDAVLIDDEPVVVQPLKFPVSNPPFVSRDPPEEFTVSVMFDVWVAEVPVPVMVTV